MIIKSVDIQKLGEIAKKVSDVCYGKTIELVGDVGAGKTTFTKLLAKNLGVTEDVQSPSFTISRVYEIPTGGFLAHYDFYRLTDAGLMADELYESVEDENTTTIVEWADIVDGVLPEDKITIKITTTSENERQIEILGLED